MEKSAKKLYRLVMLLTLVHQQLGLMKMTTGLVLIFLQILENGDLHLQVFFHLLRLIILRQILVRQERLQY